MYLRKKSNIKQPSRMNKNPAKNIPNELFIWRSVGKSLVALLREIVFF
jgi:hypothetical protein